jgi:hypothetical protein
MVYLRVYNMTDNQWVTGDANTFVLASGTDPWTYSSPSYSNGRKYRVNARALDRAGNLSPYTTSTFIWDTTLAQAALQLPDADYHNSLPAISGTAWEVTPPNGGERAYLDKAQVAIRRITAPSKWWDNAAKSFSLDDETFYDAAGIVSGSTADDWFVTGVDTPSWVDGYEYLVECRVIDLAGNISTSSVLSKQFIYDRTSPSTRLLEPAEGTTPVSRNTLATISGTALDAAPGQLQTVEVRIYDTVDTRYWKNSAPQGFTQTDAGAAWFTPALSPNATFWYCPFNENDWGQGKVYRIEARSRDRAGNYDTAYTTATFKWDRTPPDSNVG